jgi:hypothetical protein
VIATDDAGCDVLAAPLANTGVTETGEVASCPVSAAMIVEPWPAVLSTKV